jgi:hypothetical protein
MAQNGAWPPSSPEAAAAVVANLNVAAGSPEVSAAPLAPRHGGGLWLLVAATSGTLIRHDHLSSTLNRLCKLDMEQHCKWIVHGAAGLRGKGCTRMRPKLHLPVLGHVFFEPLASWHVRHSEDYVL